jgi:antitoxin (DNA-binding transcriptional repressor) of toxin-antitoxin stability system
MDHGRGSWAGQGPRLFGMGDLGLTQIWLPGIRNVTSLEAILMRTVNVATLKAKLSEYLRLARSGETVRVLDRRQAVADLSGAMAPQGQRVGLALVREGIAEWHGGKPRPHALKPRRGPARLADAVLEDRG